jgi:hypothetical protein
MARRRVWMGTRFMPRPGNSGRWSLSPVSLEAAHSTAAEKPVAMTYFALQVLGPVQSLEAK